MKKMANLCVAMTAFFYSVAQVSEAPVSINFAFVIDSVLRDFPSNLKHITGDNLFIREEIETFQSIVILPGSESCTITRYHSVIDTTLSWQAQMCHFEEFKEASRAYHELFRQLKSSYVRMVDGSKIYLNGDCTLASEENAFTVTTMRLATYDWRYRNVKVELELLYKLSNWEININIVSKERDDVDWAH